MQIEFQKPLVNNFVRTNKGLVDIKDLSPEELNEFIGLYRKELQNNWLRRNKKFKKGTKEK